MKNRFVMYRRPYPLRCVRTDGPACYHCYGRCVNKERLLADDEAKDRFVAELRRVAEFCGVEVLTFCVMSNHFHILVRVDPVAREVADAELVRRFRALYGEDKCPYINLDARRLEAVLKTDSRDAEEVREHLKSRMGSLAGFMKTLKQRYTVWYNGERGRVGTLWAERFKSCVVQDSPHVLRVVGAYIELNPVRAGLAARAEVYRWSGYGAATGGAVAHGLREWARDGILSMLGQAHAGPADDGERERFVESYARLLAVKDDTGRQGLRDGDGADVSSEEAYGEPSLLFRRVPEFLRGAAVGTGEFVARWAERLQGGGAEPPDARQFPAEGELRFARRARPEREPAADC